MKLYQYPGGDGIASISPPCLKIDLALRRIGRPFEVVDCDPRQAARISPTGRLPVVRFADGTLVEDSILILDELERRFPEAGLVPRDPRERRIDRLWDCYFNDHLYWYGFWLRWVDPENAPRFRQAVFGAMPWFVRLAVRALFLPRQRNRVRHQGTYGKDAATVRGEIRDGLDLLEGGLEGGPFLQGRSEPGRGDLAAASFVVQAGFRGTMPDIETEVLARPSIVRHAQTTFRACGAETPRWLARSEKVGP